MQPSNKQNAVNSESKLIQSRAMSGSSSSNKLSNGSNYIFYQSAFNDPKTRMLSQDIKRKEYRFVSQNLANEVVRNRGSEMVSARKQSDLAINKIAGKDDLGLNSYRAQSGNRRIGDQSGYYSVKQNLSLQSSVSCQELDSRQQIEIKKNISIQQIQKPLTNRMIQSTIIDNDNFQISRFGQSSIVTDGNLNESQYDPMLDRSKVDSLVERDCNSFSNSNSFLQERNRELQKRNGQLMQELQLKEAAKKKLQKSFSELSKSHLEYAERCKKSEQSIKISRNIITTLNEKMARAVKQNEINIKILEDHYKEELIKIQSISDEKTKGLEALIFQLKLKIIDQTNAMEQAVQKEEVLYKESEKNRLRVQKEKSQLMAQIQKFKKSNVQLSLIKSNSEQNQTSLVQNQNEIKKLNNLIASLRNGMSIVQAKNIQLERQMDSLLRLNGGMKQFQVENAILKQQNERMYREIIQIKENNQVLIRERSQLSQQIKRKVDQFRQLQHRYSIIFDQHKILEGHLDDQNKKISVRYEENGKQSLKMEEMKRQIEAMGKYIQDLNIEIEGMRRQIDQMNNFIINRNQEIQSLNIYVQGRNRQIQNMNRFIECRNLQFDVINQQNREIKNQILIVKEQNIRISEDLIRATERSEQHTLQISNYEQEIKKLREQNQSIYKELDQISKFNERLNGQLQKMNRSKEMLVDEMEQKDGKIAELNIWKGKTMLQMLELKETMKVQNLKLKEIKDSKRQSKHSQELLSQFQKQNNSRLTQNQFSQQFYSENKKKLQELDSLKAEKNKTIEINNQLTNQIKKLKEEQEQYKKVKAIESELNKQLFQQLQQSKRLNQLKDRTIDQKVRQIEQIGLIVSQNKKIVQNFQQSVKALIQSKDKLEQDVQNQKHRIQKDFDQKLQKNASQISRLTEQFQKNVTQISRLNGCLVTKQAQIKRLRQQIEEKDQSTKLNLEQQTKNNDKHIIQKDNLLKKTQQKLKIHQQQIVILQSQIIQLKNELIQVQASKKNLQKSKLKDEQLTNNKIYNLLKEVDSKQQLQQQLKKQQQQISLLQSEIVELKAQLNKRQQQMKAFQQQKKLIEPKTNQKNQNLQLQINQKQNFQQFIQKKEKQTCHLQSEISSLKSKVSELSNLITKLQQQKTSIQLSTNEKEQNLQKQISQKEHFQQSLKQRQKQINMLQSEIVSLKGQLKKVQSQMNNLQKQNKSAETVANEKIQSLQLQVNSKEVIQQLLKNHEKETHLLEQQLVSLKCQLDQMQNSMRHLQEQKKQIELITNQKIQNLTEEIKVSAKIINQHKKLIQQLNNQLTQQENQYRQVVQQQIKKITMIYSQDNNMINDLVSPIYSNRSEEEKVEELSQEDQSEEEQEIPDIQSPRKEEDEQEPLQEEEQSDDFSTMTRQRLIEKAEELSFFNRSIRTKVEQINNIEESMNVAIMTKIKIFEQNLQRNEIQKSELQQINNQLNLQILGLNERCVGFQTQIEWMNNVYRQLQNNLNDTIQELVKTQAQFFNLKFSILHSQEELKQEESQNEEQQQQQKKLQRNETIEKEYKTCKQFQQQFLKQNQNELDEKELEVEGQQIFQSVQHLESEDEDAVKQEQTEKQVNDPLEGITENEIGQLMQETVIVQETTYNHIKYSIVVSLVDSQSEQEEQKKEIQKNRISQVQVKKLQTSEVKELENHQQQKQQQFKQKNEIEQLNSTEKQLDKSQFQRAGAIVADGQVDGDGEQIDKQEVPIVIQVKVNQQNQAE